MSNFRSPAVSGLFYPSHPGVLENEVSTLLSLTAVPLKYRNIFGLVVPHAGYIYSGKTAAYGYNLLKDQTVETVIIISPSHREYFKGASVYEGDGYLTPLGKVEVDKAAAAKIVNAGNTIFMGSKGHKNEHAIEVHLPFLQVVLSKFKIVPIVMGDQDRSTIENLAKSIASAMSETTILLASSDLSHFYNRTRADQLDSTAEKYIAALDYYNFLDSLETKKCEACGGGPIAVLLKTAELMNINKAAILHRSDSGDVTGDINEVVGYLSAVVYSG